MGPGLKARVRFRPVTVSHIINKRSCVGYYKYVHHYIGSQNVYMQEMKLVRTFYFLHSLIIEILIIDSI